MRITARIIRIRNDYVRIPLFLVFFPLAAAQFAVALAWNAPERFFRPEPWSMLYALWLAGGAGFFSEME